VIETRDVPADLDEGAPSERPGWMARHPGWTIAIATLVVGLPLLVAVVALRATKWYPVLDLAMTEFRVRDVFGANTPLIGLPGRIGTYPNEGSHPGPLSFYFLAPTYRALGSSSWALEAATVVIHLAAIATALWIGARRLGWRGVVVVAALLTLVVRGYGQVALTQPWNPYLPLLAWIVVLLATWAVFCGDHRMLIPLVVAASFCAQTHVPYLPLGVGMVVAAIIAVVVQWRRAVGTARRGVVRSLVWGVAVGAVLWLPPFIDQAINDPGNIRQLLRHFGSPPEAAIGAASGLRVVLEHLDVWGGIGSQLWGTGTFTDSRTVLGGVVTLLLWIAAVVLTWRSGSRQLRALHGTVAVALVLNLVSTARIFGRVWFYLTLSLWGIALLMAGAIAWSALVLWRRYLETPAATVRATAVGAAGVVAVVGSLASTVTFASAEHPEERLSTAVGALAGPTYDAVVDGVGAATGADGTYLVRWSDAADIGSPGYGLLDELERRGLDVSADAFFRNRLTEHRTRQRAGADAQIHLATGGYVDVWRAEPEAVEVATYDPRTPEELAEYAEVEARFIERLEEEGLAELVPLVDTNLFGISTDVRLSPADHADLGRLIELGQPMVVFIAPPPSDDDPTAL
jgi:hypothetical protein